MTTTIHEIAEDVFRISTSVEIPGGPGGFSFNQILVRDEAPLLFHTGPRGLFQATQEAVGRVLPLASLRYVAYSHVEADECGAMNLFLEAAPGAVPVCGKIGAMVSMNDLADRAPVALADGEALQLGRRSVVWLDTPHVPHGWDSGLLWEPEDRTLFCGDLFTQPGANLPALSEGDILGPSVAMRQGLDYFSCAGKAQAVLARLAELGPRTLATMHGSAWRGDGAALLRALGETLAVPAAV